MHGTMNVKLSPPSLFINYLIKTRSSSRTTTHRLLPVYMASPLLMGRATAQIVSSRPLNAGDHVRSQVSPCGVCSGKTGTSVGFFSASIGFSLSVSFRHFSVLALHPIYHRHYTKLANTSVVKHNTSLSLASSILPAEVLVIHSDSFERTLQLSAL
jgi:hypothetical protein